MCATAENSRTGTSLAIAPAAGSQRVDIELVDLLAQRHALARAQRLAPFAGREVLRVEVGLGQRLLVESRSGSRVPGSAASELGKYSLWNCVRIRSCSIAGAGVDPGDRLDRRLVERLVVRDVRAVDVAGRERAEVLDVDLLDAPEAAELPLDAVEVAVVVAVRACVNDVSAPLVDDGHRSRRSAPETAAG